MATSPETEASCAERSKVPSAYSRALGAAEAALAPVIHEVHCQGEHAEVVGRFTVARGGGAVAGLLARCLGLPAAADDVQLRLRITRSGSTETWHRDIGHDTCLRTTQRVVSPGRIEERVGPTAVLLDVRADGGGLRMRQISAAIALGRLRVPLPSRLCPHTTATVAPAADERMKVAVHVTLPRGGVLISYAGVVEQVR